MSYRPLLLTAALAAALLPLPAHADPITKFDKQPTALLLTTATSTLRIEVFSPTTLHVIAANAQTLPPTPSFSVIAAPDPATQWTLEESPDTLTLKTAALHARINRTTAAITFLDPDDNILLAEADNGRSFTPPAQTTAPATAPTTLPTIPLGHLAQSFRLAPNEALFGLGQHQNGLLNNRGIGLRLLQQNTDIAIPVALSSNAYILFWDNPAVTDVAIGSTSPTPARVKGDPPIQPAGQDTLRFSSETTSDKTPINYYFCYDGSPDGSMRAYRHLTGDAPLLPEYALGFWHCKERFRSQDELLAAAREFRDRRIPIDGIIQDWRYWVDNTWGSHVFDKTRYPDPAALFKTLHDEHFHTLISVWPKFDLNTETHDQLQAAGALYPPVIPYVFPPGKGQWYDPFNPAGREIYWKQVASHLFSLGVDGWWLDAPEPELSGKWGEFRNFTTAAGPGADVFNAYPLMHSAGIYQGQRAGSDKRVVILTRSAYAGQQRNSAISWSGDIASSWDVFKKQIPAGLNFSASGIPYWNTDIGGFFNDRSTGNMNPADPRYQELFTRWFQFGAFTPMFRVHGSAPNGGAGPGKELWRFGDTTLPRLLTMLNLRYRLLPYLYSTSWQVTSNGYTMMRPLVMDFPNDPHALAIPDQYLFGPSILVCPVTTQGATSRPVYLPTTSPNSKETWYDFWTNRPLPAGTTITAPAPIDTLPLYIRAGTILPLGPLVQYANEKPDAPIELRIYPGADAHFTLYEDDTTTYAYEKGQHATIPLTWNDTTHTLTLGQREGTFPTMQKQLTFHITLATPTHATGPDPATPNQTITYTGQQITLTP